MEQPADTMPSAGRMLAAATALFAGYGYHGLSMRVLAAVTGLNVATIHYHFGNTLDRYRETLALDLLQRAQTAGAIAPAVPDLRLILPSFPWIRYGYVAGGPLDPAGTRRDPADPARVAALKQFLHLPGCSVCPIRRLLMRAIAPDRERTEA
ncbi:hypothetical protein A6A03_16585 [Chloroflexus islandicus]|uniref:HTH tetR-type domain-containing protein n=1 Tax=Chloroflexus islandicus TaxID=1707952 RepID=A0A178M958_9CHLR|nr:TetR family transcriptional regulator [Chloroflexus islandicus]OAN44424.1 hypothetical protein A6A03_16585 [Chloroflexus islandicus]